MAHYLGPNPGTWAPLGPPKSKGNQRGNGSPLEPCPEDLLIKQRQSARSAHSTDSSVGNSSSRASSTGLSTDMAILGGNAMENFRGRILEFEVLLQTAQTEVRLRDQFIRSKGLAQEYASWSSLRAATLPYTSSNGSTGKEPEATK